MINPKVSIIIPVYNGSDYVRQAIEWYKEGLKKWIIKKLYETERPD